MESVADSLSSAYQDFVGAAADVLEAKEQSNGQKSPATDAALESFKQSWELFRVSCDQAEELVESLKQRIGSECLVDEATGAPPQSSSSSSSAAAAAAAATAGGIPPISAVRLEQMSKAVRWLVIELQQHGGSASASAASVSSVAAAAASASSSAAQTPQQLPSAGSAPFDDARSIGE